MRECAKSLSCTILTSGTFSGWERHVDNLMKIRIDGNDKGRVFEGIGGVFSNGMTKLLEDYPEEQRKDILRFLFEENFGAALQHVKVEIGSDVNTSSGTVPSHMRSAEDFAITRGSELWIAAQAKRINPAITLEALRWGTPAWIKNDKDKYLYYLNFFRGAKETFGLTFDYLGCDQNEGSFDRDWVVRTLAPGLKKDGFGNIKLVAAESDSSWQIAEDILEDRDLAEVIAVLNCHYTVESTDTAVGTGLPLWSGEHLAGMRHDYVQGALGAAYNMLAMYPVGGMTMYEMHPALEANYPSTPFNYKGMIAASWPWSGHYEVTPGLWTTAHFTQFIKPGWQYLDSACHAGNDKKGEEKCGYVALKSPDGRNWSMILINSTPEAKDYTLDIAGELRTDRLHVWKTNETDWFKRGEDILPENGTASLCIPPFTICTLTTTEGQQKGSGALSVPEEKRMSLPWSDEFAAYDEDSQAKYASDQGGAFEIAVQDGKTVLMQKITEETKPVDWVYRTTPYPVTLLGSEYWTDYKVETTLKLHGRESFGYVAGRCVNNGKFVTYPSCYLFLVTGDGAWRLQRQNAVLKEGKGLLLAHGSFHTIAIAFQGTVITASLDGEIIAVLEDSFLSAGQAAIGSSYHNVCFTEIRITPQGAFNCLRYTDRDNRLSWKGDWKNKDGDYDDYGRTLTLTEEAGSTLEYAFEGTGTSIIGHRDRNGGMAKLYVDESLVKTVDTYCETENDRKTGASVPYSRNSIAVIHGLTKGIHTIRLETDRACNPASEGRVISVDVVEVTGGEGLL